MKELLLHKNLKPYLDCKDFVVSDEYYEVMKNQKYEMLVTSPVPKNLEDYYKSENYISHTDSKKNLLDKLYQIVKKITIKQKLKLINSFNTSSKRVLDIGAGTGEFLKICEKKGWEVFGVEPNLEARKIAERKNIFLKKDIKEYTNETFNIITLWHVLEHIEDLRFYIKNLKKMLDDNGTIIIAVPNYKSYDAKFYKEFWAAFDVPRHLWHFSQTSISKLFSEVDMLVVKTIPMKFDAYYVSLLSEKYKTQKTKPFTAIWKGFQSNKKAKRTSEYSSLIYVIKNEENAF